MFHATLPSELPLGWSHLQAVELADQDGLVFIVIAAQLVDLLKAVRQVLPAALCVGAARHGTTGLAGRCTAGATAGQEAGTDTRQTCGAVE